MSSSWGSNVYALNPQKFFYDFRMAKMKQINVRISAAQLRTLERLARKLQIDRSNVIRLAITRLAEAERVNPDQREA